MNISTTRKFFQKKSSCCWFSELCKIWHKKNWSPQTKRKKIEPFFARSWSIIHPSPNFVVKFCFLWQADVFCTKFSPTGEIVASGGFDRLICKSNSIQYVSVTAWVFDFRKFIILTDVSLQAMYIACAPISSLCSQDGFIHERYTKYHSMGVE